MWLQNDILKLWLGKQTFQFSWFFVKSSQFWIQKKQDQRLFDCTFAAVRTNADPEGELTNPRRSAKSSKVMRSSLFTYRIWNLRQVSFRKITCQALAIEYTLRYAHAQHITGLNVFNEKEYVHALHIRECVRNLDLRVQVHPIELWVSKQRVHIVLEALKSAGAKGDVLKICGFVHPLHPC